jgi:hypothetical protein
MGKLSIDTLIELFVSKSVFYTQYAKIFPRVHAYPKLLEWLKNGDGASTGLEIFGVEKSSYHFKDLRDVLGSLEVVAHKKGKKRMRDGEDEHTPKKHKRNKHSSKDRKSTTPYSSLM